ncbi:MAG: hypothetical protein ACR2IF_12000 [Terriglobales bacterium]
MKSLGYVLSVALLLLSTAAFAQMDHKPAAPAPSPAALQAQNSFNLLKSLAGGWEGTFTTDPKIPQMGDGSKTLLLMRVTSRGNALVHEMFERGKDNDPAKFDHPITLIHLDGDKLVLTHYCDAGNRPHMIAKTSSDGKTIDFDLVELSGSNQHGHMAHGTFTLVDADHHIEEWTYMMPGDKPLRARGDFHRVKDVSVGAGQ